MRNFLLRRKPVFTIGQFDRLSNIFDNAGQVIFGVVVLAPIVSGFDKANVLVIVSGILGTISCWVISIILAKKGKKL